MIKNTRNSLALAVSLMLGSSAAPAATTDKSENDAHSLRVKNYSRFNAYRPGQAKSKVFLIAKMREVKFYSGSASGSGW